MEFSGQYLTYEEYRGLGGTLDLMPFNLLEFEARNQIDLKTKNRLVNEKVIPQKVKICEFKLINKINSYISIDGNIASESIDGYSISYNNISEVVKSKNNELEDIMLHELYGVIVNGEHIIYIG